MATSSDQALTVEGMARQMEKQSYNAYREWPVLLAMRRQELIQHIAAAQAATENVVVSPSFVAPVAQRA